MMYSRFCEYLDEMEGARDKVGVIANLYEALRETPHEHAATKLLLRTKPCLQDVSTIRDPPPADCELHTVLKGLEKFAKIPHTGAKLEWARVMLQYTPKWTRRFITGSVIHDDIVLRALTKVYGKDVVLRFSDLGLISWLFDNVNDTDVFTIRGPAFSINTNNMPAYRPYILKHMDDTFLVWKRPNGALCMDDVVSWK